MSVCYFENNYHKKYKCCYEIKEKNIEIEAEYDISDEVEAVNGVKFYGNNTEYRERDILIIDYDNKKNILMKNAFYAGHSSVIGTPDGKTVTKFQSSVYFEHVEPDKLASLPVTPKTNRIKVFSKFINDLIGYPNLEIKESDSEFSVNLSKEKCSKSIEINSNNVKRITVADDWCSSQNRKLHNITIDFNGYIEIELVKKVKYDLVVDYLYELQIFMQLYYPYNFRVDKIYVMVDGVYYKLTLPQREFEYKEKHIEKTVQENLLDFLKNCYVTIPYRNSKTEIRNIPYIVMKTSRGIEDNFLMFYRFIECYYKKQQIRNIRTTFITYSIKVHYAPKCSLPDEQIENYAQEIICLRNHYVHSGYYIKNSCLKVSFDRINRKKNPRDYTVNNIDIHWIYERANMLYKIVVDIIFHSMLGYSDYKFSRHF